MQRHATFVVSFSAGDLGATEPPGRLNLDPRGTAPDRRLHRPLHSASEADPLAQLVRDVLRHQARVDLGSLDLLDVHGDLAVGEHGQLVTQLVHLGATLPDYHPRTRGMQDDDDLARFPLDLDVRQCRVGQSPVQIFTDRLVLSEECREVLLGIPARTPVLDYA